MTSKRLAWSIFLSMVILYLTTALLLLMKGHEDPFHPYTQLDLWFFVFGWSMGTWGYVLMTVLILLFIATIYWLMGKCCNKYRKRELY